MFSTDFYKNVMLSFYSFPLQFSVWHYAVGLQNFSINQVQKDDYKGQYGEFARR